MIGIFILPGNDVNFGRLVSAKNRNLERMKKTLIQKWRIQLSFYGACWVLLGMLLSGKIVLFPLFLFILFYTGIYALNNFFDRRFDKHSEHKKNRVKNLKETGFYALIVLVSTVVFSFFYDLTLFYFFLLFFFLNLVYTLFFKHILFLDVFIISFTLPLKIFFGSFMIQGMNLSLWPVFVSGYLFSLTTFVVKRLIEKKEDGPKIRPLLRKYNENTLRRMSYVFVFFSFILTLFGFSIVVNFLFLFTIVLSFKYRSYFIQRIFFLFY